MHDANAMDAIDPHAGTEPHERVTEASSTSSRSLCLDGEPSSESQASGGALSRRTFLGAAVIGGLALHRGKLEAHSEEFAARLVANAPA